MTDNIVKLDKILLKKAKDTIISNLKDMHHGKWVNHMCVVRGAGDIYVAETAVAELLGKNIINKRTDHIQTDNKRTCSMALYRYNSLR